MVQYWLLCRIGKKNFDQCAVVNNKMFSPKAFSLRNISQYYISNLPLLSHHLSYTSTSFIHNTQMIEFFMFWLRTTQQRLLAQFFQLQSFVS